MIKISHNMICRPLYLKLIELFLMIITFFLGCNFIEKKIFGDWGGEI